ncbi:hypothetical protein [Thermoflexus sp.]
MSDHRAHTDWMSREDAYILAGVVVDKPNWMVTAYLSPSIFH